MRILTLILWQRLSGARYSYLTFDDPSHISLNDCEYFVTSQPELKAKLCSKLDVFNTEAHPFIAPTAKSTYGGGQLQPSTTGSFVNQPGPIPQPSARPGVTGIVGALLNNLIKRDNRRDNRRSRMRSKIRAGHIAHNH